MVGSGRSQVAQFSFEAVCGGFKSFGVGGLDRFPKTGNQFRSFLEQYLRDFVQQVLIAAKLFEESARIPVG
jgi:hypothetical protein